MKRLPLSNSYEVRVYGYPDERGVGLFIESPGGFEYSGTPMTVDESKRLRRALKKAEQRASIR